jgi:hypothetical protein
MNAVTLSQLEKAHNALQRSVAIWDRVAKQDDKDLTDTTRSGVVQNFEVAYEQSWKVLRRWMMHYLGVTDTEITQRRQLAVPPSRQVWADQRCRSLVGLS